MTVRMGPNLGVRLRDVLVIGPGYVIEDERHACGCPELGDWAPPLKLAVCDHDDCGRIREWLGRQWAVATPQPRRTGSVLLDSLLWHDRAKKNAELN